MKKKLGEESSLTPLKIVYAAELSGDNSSQYRIRALEREGQTVIPFNAFGYEPKNAVIRKVVHRLVAGPQVDRLNADLLALVEAQRPDAVLADKLLWMQPRTLDRLRAMGIVTASYMIDNAFGPRRDPGWRLYMKAIPHYDLHVTQRDVNIPDYRNAGARDVMKVQTAYEPTAHFPPPQGWSDRDRNRDVSFVGTPYDDRAQTLLRLHDEAGLPVVVSGNPRQWTRAIGEAGMAKIYREGEKFGGQYREAIWRSRINLSFLTRSNQDEFVHKSFEIAACGGFLLAERSQGHLDRFIEGEEAEFFDGFDELVAKIGRYLPDEAARTRIAEAGRLRADRGGYHNDRQVALIVERLQSILQATESADRGGSSRA
jgi:spore maturation protein CgeB